MAVEEPAFRIVLQDGAFEVRDYPTLVVAEVTVTGEQKEAASKGFRLLAGYIFGGNRRKQSIAMTAPVAQEPTSEKIAMTAPVTQTQTAGEWVVQFTMPSSYSLETLPEPNDARVHLRVTPPLGSPSSGFLVSPGRTSSRRRPPSYQLGCSAAVCPMPVPLHSLNTIRLGLFGSRGGTK